MKIFRYSFIYLMILLMVSGCFSKKKKFGADGSYYGVDTPLAEFPLDSFYEPQGSDALILKNILFDYNSYIIKSSEELNLYPIIEWLKNHDKKHLLIEGHCDERGTNEYNLALGEQRALAVRQFFIKHGIEAGRVQTISYGEEKPIDPGHDEGAWRQNRRAHFLISNG